MHRVTAAILSIGCAGGSGSGGSERGGSPADARPSGDDVAVHVTIDLDGDCLEVRCPEQAPYVLGCAVTFAGGDPRGCVAIIDMGTGLYFQEGDNCDAGHLSGTMTCGSEPGAPLSPAACPIDKEQPLYVPSPDHCPDTT